MTNNKTDNTNDKLKSNRISLDKINKNNKAFFFFNCFFTVSVLIASISIAAFSGPVMGVLNFISAFIFIIIAVFAYNNSLIPKYLVAVYYFLSLFVFQNSASVLSLIGLVWSVFIIKDAYKFKELSETEGFPYFNKRMEEYQPDFETVHTLDKAVNNGEMDEVDDKGKVIPSDASERTYDAASSNGNSTSGDEIVLNYVPVAEDMYAAPEVIKEDKLSDNKPDTGIVAIEKPEPVADLPDKGSVERTDAKQEVISDTDSSLTSADEFKKKYESYFNKFDTIYDNDNDEKIS